MRKNIHPDYKEKVEAQCSCGATFIIGSTSDKIKTEICSQCHPFYTGKQKLVDSAGNVDRFKKKMEAKNSIAKERKGKKFKKAARAKVKKEKEEKNKTTK